MVLKLHFAMYLLLAPLCFGICWAAHPLITDEAATMGRGNTELEINGEYERLKDRGVRERTVLLGSSITYGVIDEADFVISVPCLFTKTKESGNTEREHGFGMLSQNSSGDGMTRAV